jgi:hypothetical protein
MEEGMAEWCGRWHLSPPFFAPSLFLYLVLDGEVDKVGVDQDLVGRAQLGVPLEEEGGRHFLAVRRRERGAAGRQRWSFFFLALYFILAGQSRVVSQHN